MNFSNTDFAVILQGMPQPYLVLDAELAIVGASDAYLALTQRTRDDIVGRHILEAFPENPEATGTVEQGPLEVSLRHVLANARPHEMAVIQYDIPKPGGGFTQKFWTPVHSPVLGADGRVRYIIQNPMDVTESFLRAREADARLRVALHAADLASWEYEPETDLWRRSHAVDELFGFAPGEGGPVAAPFFARMHPDDLGKVSEVLQGALESPDLTALNFDYRIRLPSGDTRFVASRGEILRTSDGTVRMLGVLMDVTADREREAALAAAVGAQNELLGQKDALLTEVNHRVKNSLQLVVSTLRLQARRIDDPATAAAFDQAISRVRAIISVHERLYRDNNSLTIDMEDHLRKLCLDLAGSDVGTDILVDADAIELPIEKAIPVSVIVNELLVAAVHEERRSSGPSSLSLKRSENGMIELMVGIPLHAAPGSLAASDLSAKLVSTMITQIGGTLTEKRSDGVYRGSVRFPKGLD